MLAMKSACEQCGTALPADGAEAMICSFECTFCRRCGEGPLSGTCPNCGGLLAPRPTREGDALRRHPAAS